MEKLKEEARKQIKDSLKLLEEVLGNNIIGIYLYGSATLGGLKRYNDIDLFVVINRMMTTLEKNKLVERLLEISGLYMKSFRSPIVEKEKVNPWQFLDVASNMVNGYVNLQLRATDPSNTCEMPDLAIIITQILLKSKILL